jgi:hypothetical protein
MEETRKLQEMRTKKEKQEEGTERKSLKGMWRQNRKAGAGIGGDQQARGDDAQKRKAGVGSGGDQKTFLAPGGGGGGAKKKS